jgi:hypothetical protein
MDKDELRDATHVYWNEIDKTDRPVEQMRHYICNSQRRLGKSLLKAELEYARKEQTHCKTLVLPVGFSLEPLMLSVCNYRPERLVLLLNRQYESKKGLEEGNAFGGHVIKAIHFLVDEHFIHKLPEFLGSENGSSGYVTTDTPSEVFRTLVKALHSEEDVVIDVTGGKKSMVVGAFLYAAYANVRISYVDFGEYNPESRRPYGYTCQISELSNPYQMFALHEWERLRELYSRYKFRDAYELLEREISTTVRDFLPSKAKSSIEMMIAIIKCYACWDSGDFNKAKQRAQKIENFYPPDAVTKLGDRWIKIQGNNLENKPKDLYGNLELLPVYIYDELNRISRLIQYNADYRSAFLRAGGVNEVIMLARVVSLVNDQGEKTLLLDRLDKNTPNASKVFEVLCGLKGTEIRIDRDLPFKNAPKITFELKSKMNPWWKRLDRFNQPKGYDSFLDMRNDLIHKYYPVPRSWAKDALRFASLDFEDFLDSQQQKPLELNANAMMWSNLCQFCGIDAFLSSNLRKDGDNNSLFTCS